MSGLTADGFSPKRLQDAVAELQASFRSAYGAGVSTGADSFLGNLIAVLAAREATLWEGLEAIYNALYPDTAEGTSLDQVLALAGLERLAATKSTSRLIIGADDNTTVPLGSQASVIGVPSSVFETLADILIVAIATVETVIEVGTVTVPLTYTETINAIAHNYLSVSTSYNIGEAVSPNRRFRIDNTNVAYRFYVGRTITVSGSTGNDGTYTVSASTFSGGHTYFTVNETVPSSVADGQINVEDDEQDILLGLAYAVTTGLQPVVTSPRVYPTTAVSLSPDKFTVDGDHVEELNLVGTAIFVAGSTGNDRQYTIVSAVLLLGDTVVTVSENIPVATVDGFLYLTRSDQLRTTTTDLDTPTPYSCSVSADLSVVSFGGLVEAEATVTGPIEAPADSITVIDTPVGGWVSVRNPDPANAGRNLETDFEARVRRVRSLKFPSLGTFDSMIARVGAVEGVSALFVYENTTLVTDSFGLPGKAFEVVAKGGNDQDIADTIWQTKPIGIEAFGDESVQVEDAAGGLHTVKFTRPVEVSVDVDVTVYTNDEEGVVPSDGDVMAAVETAIRAYFASLRIGQDVRQAKIEAVSVTATTGLADVSVTDPAADVTIARNEYAVPGAITVTVTPL